MFKSMIGRMIYVLIIANKIKDDIEVGRTGVTSSMSWLISSLYISITLIINQFFEFIHFFILLLYGLGSYLIFFLVFFFFFKKKNILTKVYAKYSNVRHSFW